LWDRPLFEIQHSVRQRQSAQLVGSTWSIGIGTLEFEFYYFMSLLRVLESRTCIGCGACACVVPDLRPRWDGNGFLSPQLAHSSEAALDTLASKVCPFSDLAEDEDSIGARLYQGSCSHRTQELGWFVETYVGYCRDPETRSRGSSGGLGRWLLATLLRTGLADACIHVSPVKPHDASNGALFQYVVSRTTDEVLNSATSAYYPVHLADAMRYVQKNSGRYAIIGVPCFIKAVRLLQQNEEIFAERIRFTIGLFCGHWKSRLYAEMLAWQLGIAPPDDIAEVNFRQKVGPTAKDKGFVAKSASTGLVQGPRVISSLFGGDYSLGFFQHRGCDYCDDVAAETADITIGDAWLPEYIPDAKGTSVVVVRSPEIHQVLLHARDCGEIVLESIDPRRVVESQAGAFRHRREGLAYRLWLDTKAKRWHPRKRVSPSSRHLDRRRRAIYETRVLLREKSTPAFLAAKQRGDFEQFRRVMSPLVARYRRLYQRSLIERVIRRFKRIVSRVFRIGLS